jgi:phospholipase C
MARFSAVWPFDLSLHKRCKSTILSGSCLTAETGIDPSQQSHFASPRLGQFLWVVILVAFCSATLGVAAQTLSPTSVAFGAWVVQTTSTTQTFKFTNTQTVPLTINSISVSGDFAQTSHCPIAPNTLAAGATCQVPVTFTPTLLGARTGTLTVNDNGSNSPQTAPLSGTGVSPAALNPASVSFGNQAINTPSPAKVVTLVNYQNVPLAISGITTSGDYAQTSNCPISPNTLAVRTSCAISVTFTPTAAGSRSGKLTVNDNASNNPQTAQLSGNGVLVTLLPATLGFGNQFVNSTSAAKTVTLQNNQTVALTITRITASGMFAQSSNCPLSPNTLSALGSCTISVTFTPTITGNQTGTLTVTDNAPETTSLTGTGMPPIQHVVVIFQENRTPDNLFQDPVLVSRGADIASSGVNSQGQIIPLSPIALDNTYDLSHLHPQFVAMYDDGKMDGADKIPCVTNTPPCPANPQFMFVNPQDVEPYFSLAEQYTFGDRMFQTNQGGSFPAHQFIIAGTSAPTATSPDFADGNPAAPGCLSPPTALIIMIDPWGNENTFLYPCFEHPTLIDEMDASSINWRYYVTPAGAAASLWTAPYAIQHLCQPQTNPNGVLVCTGADWQNVTLSNKQVLTDIANNQLPQVSWVIPTGSSSDHANMNDGSGPSWVASIVNAIGESPYWSNTAIIITWDDWGGWYDHVAPQVINDGSSWGSGYVYGFRVPLIVVSPYAKPAYISHTTHDFGSILRFIEGNYNLPSLGYADNFADDLSDCFDFSQTPIPFNPISAPLHREFFLNDKRPPTPPDDD